MFTTLSLARRRTDGVGAGQARLGIWATFGLLALLLVGYGVSIAVRHYTSSTLIDGWGVDTFDFAACCMCLGVMFAGRRNRAVPLLLGCALLSWTTGDVFQTIPALSQAEFLCVQLPNLPYLAFYPLAYAGLVLLMRRDIKHLGPVTGLDGIVAGLGAAAICASFIFQTPILRSLGGDPLQVGINLAFPVGDLLLLAMVVGGTAVFQGRPKPQWLLIAAACVVIVVGDTFNLMLLASHSGALATFSHAPIGVLANNLAWPTTMLLVAAAMWVGPGPTNLLITRRAPGFLLPGAAALAALVILVLGAEHAVSGVALRLAVATLVVAGLRAGLSASRLRRLTDERQRQSVTDHLTGLGNRRRMFSLLDAYFADRADPSTPDQSLSFLFIDLDHFKEINDSFGHSAGDALLRELGPRLTGALRSSDALVRVGGDELGVLITGAEPTYAAAVAERILLKLREPFHLNSVTVRISASIGVATAPQDASDSAGLLRSADLAMYRAKVTGAPFEVYRREIDDEGSRLRLADDLRRAVEEGLFQLHYQPQLDLHTGLISTVEALLRWPHPRLGMVAPPDFLPLAEEVGLMRRLTSLVLDMALSQCAAWRAEGRQLVVSVNISISDLLDPTFMGQVLECLAQHRLPASCLVLEIIETTIIKDFEGCRAAIEQLRAAGLGVSIDDFGAGFTSLAYLGDLAVSELKLDRTFILGLNSGRESDRALVRATIDLGHALGLRVVAEGVEDEPALNLLTGMGCDLAQGYFISRPQPPDAFSGRPGFGLNVVELVKAS
ncbi:MAG: putative bifunctional diguanylate cyclase/phosphodiesterase [Candidatus Dormibacteria bacterium]